jgi:hypothetical protein
MHLDLVYANGPRDFVFRLGLNVKNLSLGIRVTRSRSTFGSV